MSYIRSDMVLVFEMAFLDGHDVIIHDSKDNLIFTVDNRDIPVVLEWMRED